MIRTHVDARTSKCTCTHTCTHSRTHMSIPLQYRSRIYIHTYIAYASLTAHSNATVGATVQWMNLFGLVWMNKRPPVRPGIVTNGKLAQNTRRATNHNVPSRPPHKRATRRPPIGVSGGPRVLSGQRTFGMITVCPSQPTRGVAHLRGLGGMKKIRMQKKSEWCGCVYVCVGGME